ncbi:hypothetical protein H0V99_01580 [Candidatus Saccharibacteria bacterium]|nr:hypothetical protein [Candidatus Saccharibacteria bacterium]
MAAELAELEAWLVSNGVDEDDVHFAVGLDLAEKNSEIMLQAQKLSIRFANTSGSQRDQIMSDWRSLLLASLTIKYDGALGEGFTFLPRDPEVEFPHIARLAKLDRRTLRLHIEEAFDRIQDLYDKHFPRG